MPYDNVYIQGSSLRKPLANDVDIAILISKEDVSDIKEMLKQRAKVKYGQNEKEYNKFISSLEEKIKKGIIKNGDFGKIDDKSFMQELYKRGTFPKGKKLNISIIIKQGGFDTPPYLKL